MSMCEKCGVHLPYSVPRRPRRLYSVPRREPTIVSFEAKRAQTELRGRYRAACDEVWGDDSMDWDERNEALRLLAWHMDAERRRIYQAYGPATMMQRVGPVIRLGRKNSYKERLCFPCRMGWPTGDEPEPPPRGDPVPRPERAERRRAHKLEHKRHQSKERR